MVKHAAGSATSLDPVKPLLGDTGSSAPSQVPAREYLDLTKDVRDEGAVQLLREILTTARKIVVIAGAGISVAAGIPDFRGSKGMFATMKAKGRSEFVPEPKACQSCPFTDPCSWTVHVRFLRIQIAGDYIGISRDDL